MLPERGRGKGERSKQERGEGREGRERKEEGGR